MSYFALILFGKGVSKKNALYGPSGRFRTM